MALAITDYPDFSRLLENNEAPSKATIDQVNELLEEPMKELRSIQAEIRHLATLIQNLKEKEQATQATINLYNKILSPARRVPLEIWSEIFYHCLPTQRNPIMSTSDAPLLLTRICSAWRSAALSSPRLWARLHIPFACDTQENRRQDFARKMKQRSEVLYTSYNREESMSWFQWEAQISLDLFSTILPFASRWNDLELCMPSDIYQMLDAMLSVDMVPMLRCWRVCLHEQDPRRYPYPTNTFILARAPNLRKITFNAAQFNPILMEYNLTLTYLCLYSLISHKHAFMLLNKCPNLVHCKLAVLNTQGEEFEPPNTVSLPHLRSLCIQDLGRPDLSKAFCDSISAPNLKWINYQRHPAYQLNTEIPLPVLSLIERANSITKLTFESRGLLSIRDMSQCFQLAPLIRHLVIGPEPHGPSRTLPRHQPGVIMTDFDLNLLTVKATREETLLPNLEVFEASFTTNFSDEELLKFINGRLDLEALRSGIAALKCVRMAFNRPRERDITADVERYAKAAGIDFNLELAYLPEPSSATDPLSPSFGLTEDGRSWHLQDIED